MQSIAYFVCHLHGESNMLRHSPAAISARLTIFAQVRENTSRNKAEFK